MSSSHRLRFEGPPDADAGPASMTVPAVSAHGHDASVHTCHASPLDGPRLFALADVASRLTISLRSAKALVASGALPIVRILPRRIAVAEADLAAFIAARRGGGR